MAIVRIAHAEPRPGRLGNGGFQTRGFLVVLADDAGHRAVPAWLRGEPGEENLSRLVELRDRSALDILAPAVPQELTTRLLDAADARVTGVDIDVTGADADELSPEVSVARVTIAGPLGTRQVTAAFGLGLAVAAAAGVPVRLADAVLDRLATPVAGDDLLTPFLDRVPPAAQVVPGRGLAGWPMGTLPGKRPRFEPRNMDFADGLDRWDLERPEDYRAGCATGPDGQQAVLSSAVPRPSGPAALGQAIYADDYRGTTVTFAGDIRTAPLTEQAGLRLEILRRRWRTGNVREDHGVTVSGRTDWTRHQVTALIPEDADIIRFGITLTGAGQVSLRHPALLPSGDPAERPAGQS